jgi:diguanylate cyclase (GGDEF)-like protein
MAPGKKTLDDLLRQNRELKNLNDELEVANEVLSRLSVTDSLTGLRNHRYFQESLTREIKRWSRTDSPFSILLVDLDDFKTVNDSLGHASGDKLLARVASIMTAVVRESDLLARYGGEEFVVLAADTALDDAVCLADKIREAIARPEDHFIGPGVTVSIGVAQYAGDRCRFFEEADRALYRAKDLGKNRVSWWWYVPDPDPAARG